MKTNKDDQNQKKCDVQLYHGLFGQLGSGKLLMYSAFCDFGLTTQDFINCLKCTHNALRLSARLNKIHLSRVTRSAEFFPVPIEKLRFLQGIKGIKVFGCCIQDASGELSYSEELTKLYEDWRKGESRSSGVHDPELIFGVDKARARCIGQGYFECGEDRLEVSNMWVIKRAPSGGAHD